MDVTFSRVIRKIYCNNLMCNQLKMKSLDLSHFICTCPIIPNPTIIRRSVWGASGAIWISYFVWYFFCRCIKSPLSPAYFYFQLHRFFHQISSLYYLGTICQMIFFIHHLILSYARHFDPTWMKISIIAFGLFHSNIYYRPGMLLSWLTSRKQGRAYWRCF